MTDASPDTTAAGREFDLRQFSSENLERCQSPRGFNHPLSSWSLSDWMTATLGELGEAANVLQAAGIDLPNAVRRKFDRTSKKIGYVGEARHG